MTLRYVLASVLVFTAAAIAQPKREFRAAWIATVSNVDWPVSASDAPSKQQADLTAIYDSLARIGMNAVVFQVRPSADALYPSTIEPWSQWLTGTQGVAPSVDWDPLQYALTTAHNYGMEFHAWFNPYRTVVSTSSSSIASSHISVTRPEWNLTFGTLKMLDPGLPEVREYVTSVIMDVVRRYDIDGVHFDDYFYPYSGVTTEDQGSYAAYGGGMPLADWRRQNVDQLIKMVHDSIKAVKPRVKFGISPFGIWRNQSSDPAGSATNGTESYSALYANTRRWLQEGWVDYMNPQIYWYIGRTGADYQILVPWWDQNANGRHIYVGHGTWHAFDQNWGAKEIINQINLNRTYPNVLGSVHFSAKWFVRSTINSISITARRLNDSLKNFVYQRRALRPTMSWIDDVMPNPPESLTIQKYTSFGLVKWKAPSAATDGDLPVEYVMYRSMTLPIDFNDFSQARLMNGATSWAEGNPTPGTVMYFAVTSLDRHQNESAPSNIMGLTSTGTVGVGEELELPSTMRLYQNFPNPFNPATVVGFSVANEVHVTLRVYDLLGREVATLWDGMALAGYRQVTFDARGLPSGTYFVRMTANGRVETIKMQFVR